MTNLMELQARTAQRFGAIPDIPSPDLKVGIAQNVSSGLQPLNALRHPSRSGTSGWYIWAGEELSQKPDFFAPLHVSHLSDWCPDLLPYLGLPPGWCVLLAPGYEDVWFDGQFLF